MKYEGYIEDIDGIIKLLEGDIRCKQINNSGDKGYYKDMGLDDKSSIALLRFEIILNNCMMTLKVETNYRDGWGWVEMRDDKAWHLAAAIPAICNCMSKLSPFYREKPRGRFLRAMDKLIIGEDGGAVVINNGRVGLRNGKKNKVAKTTKQRVQAVDVHQVKGR